MRDAIFSADCLYCAGGIDKQLSSMVCKGMQNLSETVEEAVDFLRVGLGDSKVLVCISGGKDSIVTAKLVELAGLNYRLQSTLTGIDPPELTRFIRRYYPQCTFVRPRQSFWHLITTHNPPGGTGRGIKWCCTKIKEAPSWKSPELFRILGVRAEEGTARSKYERVQQHHKNPLQVMYYPILNWKEWKVWEFIERFRLPYSKLYDEGFNRLGCVVCPNHSGKDGGTHWMYRERWPGHFECFERYVRMWWDKRVGQGREMWHDSVEAFLDDWYAGKFYYYKH